MNRLLADPKTALTAAVAFGWLMTFIVRIYKPEFSLGATFDAICTTVMGYWFTTNKKDGGV